jgi:hypothetical protein
VPRDPFGCFCSTTPSKSDIEIYTGATRRCVFGMVIEPNFSFEGFDRMRFAIWRLLALLGWIVVATNSAMSQQTARPQTADENLFTYFYKDPQPARLAGYLERYEKIAPRWDAFPPLVGFLAVVFHQSPDWTDRLIPAQPGARSATAIAAALRLAGRTKVEPRLLSGSSDPKLVAELAGLPLRLEDLRVVTPTHLDILWGASFASGEERYVRLIIDRLAVTANRSELTAIDVTRTALAIWGGRQEILGQLKGKYGEREAYDIVVAATAAWALGSNARRHEFVEKAMKKYSAEHAGSHAAKVLLVLGSKK